MLQRNHTIISYYDEISTSTKIRETAQCSVDMCIDNTILHPYIKLSAFLLLIYNLNDIEQIF